MVTCTVFFGPSVGLVNYVPTRLAVRVGYSANLTSAWADYDGYIYPTKLMTVTNM